MENELSEVFGAAISEVMTTETTVVKDGVSEPSQAESVPTTNALNRLAQYVLDTFRQNRDARLSNGIEQKLTDALQAATCTYTNVQKDKLRRAGIDPRLYAPITATKVRAAKAMLVDIFNSSGEWPFTLSPTPDPDLPESVREQIDIESQSRIQQVFANLQQQGVQELPPQMMAQMQELIVTYVNGRYDELAHQRDAYAKVRAKRMERKVQDIMTEGGWIDAFNEYVNYICIYGTGLIIGPVPRVVPTNRCKENKRTGTRKYVREYRMIPTYEAVSPVDCYPAPDARKVDDGPLCIRVRYMPNELRSYVMASGEKDNSKSASGWMVGTMNALLRRWPHGGCKINLEFRNTEIKEAENQTLDDTHDCSMEGIRCFSSVRGSELIDFGVITTPDGMKIVAENYYSTEIIVIDSYVVYCRIIDDRLGRPVSKGVFCELPGSWWGESIASKLHSVQITMNNMMKSLMQNMSVASGAMYWIKDISRLADKSPDGARPRAHKVFAFSNSTMGGMDSGAPMGVINTPSNASELLAVFDKMKIQADDDSGIPAYTYGQSSGQGALRTASGLAIFSEAASRGMKMVIGTTDRLVTRDQVRKTCNWILLYDEDIDLKGDCEVNPAGVMGKILKAQQDQQRLQFLNMAITNPMLQQIFGPKGIVALLRPSIQDLAINPDDCLPSDDKLKEMELVQQIQQVFAATQAQQGVAEAATGEEGAGAPPGVEQAPSVGGDVEARRSVA